MGLALYRKYRSKSLDEIVGQSHITDMLKRAISNDRVSHAYLLTGPRGVGKTSIARILAHDINKLPYTDESVHLDIIEIDAASNNSVEDIRDLREKVMIAPTKSAKKIYIIDEVHMLSKQAFNALLKTLEEPPAHVVFILATTDIEKLPATIISRVQRFNFRLIPEATIVDHLRKIATAENIKIDDGALKLIAHHGKGSFRDSISLLDQLQHVSDGQITSQQIELVLGLANDKLVSGIIDAYLAGDLAAIVQLLDSSQQQGTPALVLSEQLIYQIRNRITTEPALVTLLDNLLDVTKSAWPDVKLLTALSKSNLPQSTSVQVATPNLKVTKKPTATATLTTTSQSEPSPEPSVEIKSAPKNNPKAETEPKSSPSTTTNANLNWAGYIESFRSESPGVAAILGKIGHKYENNRLTLFAINKFNKAKLDKNLPQLTKMLADQAIDAEIIILADPIPPTNSQAAAVLDIMGGGQEVSL